MQPNNHVIQRQVAEIAFYDKAGVQQLFGEMSDLFNMKLSNITNHVFDRLAPSGMFIRIDRLELDLGTFPYPFDEEEFVERYETKLEEALHEQMKQTGGIFALLPGENHDDIFRMGQIELLRHFLLKGAWHGWAGEEMAKKPSSLFFALLAEDSYRLKELLLQTGPYSQVRKRLVNQFPEQVIHEVITLKEPSESGFILAYHRDISAYQRKEQPIKTEANLFEKALWYFILTYLFVEMGSHFQRKTFVKSTLMQMAAHFNLSYDRLLSLFSQTAKVFPDWMRASSFLPSLILELTEETRLLPVSAKAFSVEAFLVTHDEDTNGYEEILLHFLFYGSLPFSSHHYDPVQTGALLKNMLQQAPERLRQLLGKQGRSEPFVKRLVYISPEHLLINLIHFIEPVEADFIISYHSSALNLQHEKNIVKAEESEFRNSLWEFIFAFLLNYEGSLFNQKAFVESNIRKLAGHYNLDFRELLLFLTQGLGEGLATIGKPATLFYLFTEILREQTGQTQSLKYSNAMAIAPVETITTERESIKYTTFIRDVLLFWLTQGDMPWWSGSDFSAEPSTLLAQYISASPGEALRLLQTALQKGIARSIFLSSISSELIDILQQAPEGNVAVITLEEVGRLILQQRQANATIGIHEAVLAAVLDAYHENLFRGFDLSLFFSILLKRLQQTSGLTRAEIANQIARELKASGKLLSKKLINVLTETMAKEKEISLSFENEHQFSLLKDEEALQVDDQLLADIPVHEQLAAALNLMEYFLRHNRFPGKRGASSKAETNSWLYRLVRIIYQQDQAKLKNLLEGGQLSATARLHLHDVFVDHNDQVTRNISSLLADYAARDTLEYLQEKWPQLNDTAQIDEALAWIEKNANVTLRKKIYTNLLASPSMARLMAAKYKGAAFTTLLQYIINEEDRSLIHNVGYLLSLAIHDSFERENLMQHYREFCFIWFSGATNRNQAGFFTLFLQFLSQRKNWNVSHLNSQLATLPPKLAELKSEHLQGMVLKMESTARDYSEKTVYRDQLLKTQEEEDKKIIRTVTGLQPEKAVKEENREASKKESDLIDGEKIYINNAGLVLLNPFLSGYFAKTGLTAEGKFVDEAAQHRAPHLLQYLVNNAEETGEQDLVLNKILCGILPETSIPMSIALSNEEKDIAEGLLMAVTHHWDKLKNTSVQSFQASFLQREGALSQSPEAWSLKVEERAYDILLQTLPWGMSLIKYPWMDKPLLVEWI